MKIEKLILSILLLLLATSNAKSEISYTPATTKSSNSIVVPKILIYGQIKQEDARQFHNLLDVAKASWLSLGQSGNLDQFPLVVELDSPGGSVDAAITIGKEVRKIKPMSVNVKESEACVSACVMILAGGPSRYVQGGVGIHRPYLDNDKAETEDKQKQNYAIMEKMIKDYLVTVNVPTSLYDVMFRIPPEKVRYLSPRELQDFNLNEDDPFFKEAKDAVSAKYTGLTKSEFHRQFAECEHAQSPNDCFNQLFKPH